MTQKINNINIGDKFGRLTVISKGKNKTYPSGQTKITWDCKCDCGKEHNVVGQKLALGEIRSCGCSWEQFMPHNRKELKEGDKIGPFTFLKEAGTKNLKRFIEVKCFCGKSKITTLYVAEHSKSCGCLNSSKRDPRRAEQVRINSSNRRGKIKSTSDGTINIEAITKLLDDQGGVCNICGIDIMDRTSRHLDHIFPISKGGTHSIDNVQWLCASCNLSKSDKIL